MILVGPTPLRSESELWIVITDHQLQLQSKEPTMLRWVKATLHILLVLPRPQLRLYLIVTGLQSLLH